MSGGPLTTTSTQETFSEDVFEILKHLHQNLEKILKKCFHATTFTVTCVESLQQHILLIEVKNILTDLQVCQGITFSTHIIQFTQIFDVVKYVTMKELPKEHNSRISSISEVNTSEFLK